ncbi:sensor histidine kinase [Sphaerisporangium perillae]|uniref:sensor histidine kinase n=1 Tax=Sphaerisporangium perillae TaxID=2935860 RepID=UPI00200D10C8|nr:HAMP domain-containing sensor histidine kinase [Sphaerisporangium perillae]
MRRRLVLVSTASVAVALLLLTLGFGTVLSRSLDRDADLVLRSRAEATLTTLEVGARGLVVEDLPLDEAVDAHAWVFDASGRVVAQPRAAPGVAGAARSLWPAQADRFLDVGDVRLLAVPALDRSTVVVSVSRVPYLHSEWLALLAALLLDAVVLVLVVILTRRVVIAALRPVAAMTRQALDWSEHDLDHRFALGPPRDELTGLAANLDLLLERVAANLRHERRLSAEIAHELRTPLARLRAEAEIALSRKRPYTELRAALLAVTADADDLTRVVDTLLGFSRTEVRSTGCQVGDVLAAMESQAIIEPTAGPLPRVGCETDLVARTLAPLVHNARTYGTTATLSVRQDDAMVVFTVTDDGPGVQPGEEEAIFEPARRGSAAHLRQGSGLGLSLSRRLAQAAGGDVLAIADAGGGLFQLRLPRA